jgi:hypothetical protein
VVADAEQQRDREDDADAYEKCEREDPLAENQPHETQHRQEPCTARTPNE